MNRASWIVADFVLATIVAILGNIVASYLQEQYKLTDASRFTFVIVLFVICLGLLLFVTLKQFYGEQNHQVNRGGSGESGVVQVRQDLGKLLGRLTGAKVGEMRTGQVNIDQKVNTIEESGEMIGFEGKKIVGGTLETKQEVDRVDKDGNVTGISIDKLG